MQRDLSIWINENQDDLYFHLKDYYFEQNMKDLSEKDKIRFKNKSCCAHKKNFEDFIFGKALKVYRLQVCWGAEERFHI